MVGSGNDLGFAHPVRKIAVVRANGIGDYLFAVPALCALRARFAQAEIVLLGKQWHRDLLTGRPGPIDRVEVIPRCRGVGADTDDTDDHDGLERFFAAMAAERFDLAIQLHGGGRYSNPFTRRLRARFAIGLKSPDAEALDAWIPYFYFQPEVLRYIEVMSLVGAAPVTVEPDLAVTPADDAEVDRLQLPDDRPWVVLHPGATDGRRLWPVTQFAAVADYLVDSGARIIVSGGESERAIVDAVVGAMRREAIALCQRLSLGGLAALLARSHVVISNDSGPLHLAGAVGARTIGLYWCGNMINGGPTTRRKHHPFVSWRLHCPVCERNTLDDNCDHRASFIADIPVQAVMQSAATLLAEARDERTAAKGYRRATRA
ncbi:MAG: glycosyltransferase family 9 protein [Gammaproteobacteria bacterium]